MKDHNIGSLEIAGGKSRCGGVLRATHAKHPHIHRLPRRYKKTQNIIIGVVGACGSGKSSLVAGLSEFGYHARHIAQEHSFTPDMWQRLTKPDVLIFLHVSYPLTLQRKHFTWTLAEYEKQLTRLRHANQHADLHVDTDDHAPDEVLRVVLDYLSAFEGE